MTCGKCPYALVCYSGVLLDSYDTGLCPECERMYVMETIVELGGGAKRKRVRMPKGYADVHRRIHKEVLFYCQERQLLPRWKRAWQGGRENATHDDGQVVVSVQDSMFPDKQLAIAHCCMCEPFGNIRTSHPEELEPDKRTLVAVFEKEGML
jgi:hypothetical protein